jgi:hypothetical protein
MFADELFTPIDDYFHQGRDSDCDDQHQNLVVIHGRYLLEEADICQGEKASILPHD